MNATTNGALIVDGSNIYKLIVTPTTYVVEYYSGSGSGCAAAGCSIDNMAINEICSVSKPLTLYHKSA